MAAISIPNTFVNGTPADATQVNANFTAVTAQVNGNLDNSNVAAGAAVVESKIAFDGAAGHDHSGGAEGTTIAGTSVSLAQLNHASNGRGTVKIKQGAGSVSVGALSSTLVTYTGEAFTQRAIVSIVVEVNPGENGHQLFVSASTSASFRVVNDSGGAMTFLWSAIGI